MAFVRHRILISPSFDCLLSFSHSSQLRNCNQRGDFKVTRRVLISTTGVRSSLVCYNFVQWNSWSYWGVLIAWDKCGLICCLCLSHSSPVSKPHVLILFVFSHSAERNVMIEIPLIIFILLCFNVLSTVPRENRLADFLYIYIYIYIYTYMFKLKNV